MVSAIHLMFHMHRDIRRRNESANGTLPDNNGPYYEAAGMHLLQFWQLLIALNYMLNHHYRLKTPTKQFDIVAGAVRNLFVCSAIMNFIPHWIIIGIFDLVKRGGGSKDVFKSGVRAVYPYLFAVEWILEKTALLLLLILGTALLVQHIKYHKKKIDEDSYRSYMQSIPICKVTLLSAAICSAIHVLKTFIFQDNASFDIVIRGFYLVAILAILLPAQAVHFLSETSDSSKQFAGLVKSHYAPLLPAIITLLLGHLKISVEGELRSIDYAEAVFFFDLLVMIFLTHILAPRWVDSKYLNAETPRENEYRLVDASAKQPESHNSS